MFRKTLGALAAFATLLIAGEAAAQATTYTFTTGTYDAGLINNTACTGVGECTTYTTAQRLVVTLTFSAPLAPNLASADRRATLTGYTANDGVRTTTGPTAQTAVPIVNIGTDATGTPNVYQVVVERTPGPPYPVNDVNDPNSRVTTYNVQPGGAGLTANGLCAARLGDPLAGPGACASNNVTPGYSAAGAFTPTVVTFAPAGVVSAVPTMSEWAMILFALIMVGSATLNIQRRQFTA